MEFIITREELVRGLQLVTGVVERRQNLPILANILLRIEGEQLVMIGTDLEIEMTSRVTPLNISKEGATTVSGRKLSDICRALPESSRLFFQQEDNKINIKVDKSYFSLASLPATDFPTATMNPGGALLQLESTDLVQLLESTYFSMAQQDVRYYLNGLLFELSPGTIRTVATDGHRLALKSLSCDEVKEPAQFILPRKGVIELLRLLSKEDKQVLEMHYSENSVKFSSERFVFISRLVDGRFPDYHRVIPKNGDKIISIDRDGFRQVLQRVAILSNEKYHAVSFRFEAGLLSIRATNIEKEEANDELPIVYEGPVLEMGFNVNYLLEVLSVMPSGEIKFTLSTAGTGAIISSDHFENALYVIMPLCL